jgi:hypothetical protein
MPLLAADAKQQSPNPSDDSSQDQNYQEVREQPSPGKRPARESVIVSISEGKAMQLMAVIAGIRITTVSTF